MPALVWWLACVAPVDGDPLADMEIVTADLPDRPIDGVSDEWLARFRAGDERFEQVFRESTGLGPAYIRHACASCHADDARGPGEVEKFVLVGADGVTALADQSPLTWGNTARPQVAGGATTALVIPERDDLLVTVRAAPATFGRGYLEAIEDREIERIEAEQAAAEGLISGRIARVAWGSEANPDARFHAYGPGSVDLIGRMGLKGRIATVDEFVADAFQGDMAITSPLRPVELPNPDGLTDDQRAGMDVDLEAVNVVADYVRLIAIPRRAEVDGEDLFAQVGCDQCHTPRLRTRDDYLIPQIAGVEAPVYTDLLLHDMGEGFEDGLPDGGARPGEWKTAPLMGLRHLRSYLHDGSAATVQAAIEAHDAPRSESAEVMDAWYALSDADRARLLTFVESL